MKLAFANAARAGNQHAAFIREIMIMHSVTPAKPVKERLEAFCHIRPVNRADPDNPVRFRQCLIDFSKIIPDHTAAFCAACSPAVPAGSAVFQLFPVQMNLK